MATAAIGLAISVGTQLVATALTPAEVTQNGKIDDLDITRSEYGTNIPIPTGRYRYFGCNIIWSMPLREVEETTKVGGKGLGRKQVVEDYTYYGTWANIVSEFEISDVTRIWFNGLLQYDKFATGTFETVSTDFLANHVEIYKGTTTQLPSPTIEATEGVGNVPAFRGRCYLVFRDVNLNDFGNRQVKVDVEVVRDQNFPTATTITDQQASLEVTLEDICDLAGYDTANDIDIQSGAIFGGFSFANGGNTYRDYIKELQKYFLFLTIISQGKLKFVTQSAYSAPPTIASNELNAREYGSSPGNKYSYELIQNRDLPSTIEITFPNIDFNHDPGYAIAMRNSADFQNNQTYSTAIAMTDSQAYTAANRLLNQLWAQKTKYNDISLMPQYLPWLEPGHIFTINANGKDRVLQIASLAIGQNYLIDIEATNYDANFSNIEIIPTNPLGGYNNEIDSIEITTANSATPIILDIPLLSSTDSDDGVYFSYLLTPGETLLGGSLFYSVTTLNMFQANNTVATEATCGIFTVPAVGGAVETRIGSIDRETEFFLSVTQGKPPATISDAEFTQFEQLAVLTDGAGRYEIICYQVSTLVTTDLYRITNVIRGMFGTEADQFQPGESATFYGLNNESTIYRQTFLSAVTGTTFDYRLVPSGFDVFDTTNTTTETFTNRSAQPYAPTNPKIHRDSSNNDHTFSWTRRTRKNGQWTQLTLEVPLNEAFEQYDVEFWNVGNTAVVGTFTVLAPNITLTQAQLLSFYGIVPTTFNFRVYQLSNTIGRGQPLIVVGKSITSSE